MQGKKLKQNQPIQSISNFELDFFHSLIEMVQNQIISNFIQSSTECFHITGNETNLLLASFI